MTNPLLNRVEDFFYKNLFQINISTQMLNPKLNKYTFLCQVESM